MVGMAAPSMSSFTVPVTVLLAALYWSESFGAVVSVRPP